MVEALSYLSPTSALEESFVVFTVLNSVHIGFEDGIGVISEIDLEARLEYRAHFVH